VRSASTASLVLGTHAAPEGRLQQVVDALRTHEDVASIDHVIRIEAQA